MKAVNYQRRFVVVGVVFGMSMLTLSLMPDISQAQEGAASSTSTVSSYTYKARNFRDPFVPVTMTGAGSSGSSGSSATKFSSVKEMEDVFSVDDLVLKAIMTDHIRGEPIALLSMVSNPDDNFIVKGSRLKHIATGLVLASYRARIEQENVIIERVQGEPLMSVLAFPSKDERRP